MRKFALAGLFFFPLYGYTLTTQYTSLVSANTSSPDNLFTDVSTLHYLAHSDLGHDDVHPPHDYFPAAFLVDDSARFPRDDVFFYRPAAIDFHHAMDRNQGLELILRLPGHPQVDRERAALGDFSGNLFGYYDPGLYNKDNLVAGWIYPTFILESDSIDTEGFVSGVVGKAHGLGQTELGNTMIRDAYVLSEPRLSLLLVSLIALTILRRRNETS